MNPTQTETVDSRRCGAFFKKRRSEAILVETKAVELCSISLVYTNCTGGKREPERSSMRWALSAAIDSRRYEWSVSGMNEQILVEIRSGATLSHKLYFYWFDRRKKA